MERDFNGHRRPPNRKLIDKAKLQNVKPKTKTSSDLDFVRPVAGILEALTPENLVETANELRALIDNNRSSEFLYWLAENFVKQAKKNNVQDVLFQLLSVLSYGHVFILVEDETMNSIEVSLSSEHGEESEALAYIHSKRIVLKNLGSFLGMLTISRNRPIVDTRLDLRELLIIATDRGGDHMMLLVPFVAKVLFSCKYSTLFNTKCAWVRQLLFMLVEMYCGEQLSNYVQFELEALFQHLQLSPERIENERLNACEPVVARYEQPRTRNILEIKEDKPYETVLRGGDGADEVQYSDSVADSCEFDSDLVSSSARSEIIAPSTIYSVETVPDSEYDEYGYEYPLMCTDVPSTSNSRTSEYSYGAHWQMTLGFELLDKQEWNFAPLSADSCRPCRVTYEGLDVSSVADITRYLYLEPLKVMNCSRNQLRYLVECAVVFAVRQVLIHIQRKVTKETFAKTDELLKKEFAGKGSPYEDVKAEALKMTRAISSSLAHESAAAVIWGLVERFLRKNLFDNKKTDDVVGGRLLVDGNSKVGICFVVKYICEKAVAEMEKSLTKQMYLQIMTSEPPIIPEELPSHHPSGKVPAPYEVFEERKLGFDEYDDFTDPIRDLPDTFIHLTDTPAFLKQLNSMIILIMSWQRDRRTQGQDATSLIEDINKIVRRLHSDLLTPREGPPCVPRSVIYYIIDHFLLVFKPDLSNVAQPFKEEEMVSVTAMRRLQTLFLDFCRGMIAQISGSEFVRLVTRIICSKIVDYKEQVDAFVWTIQKQLIHCGVLDRFLSKALLHKDKDKAANYMTFTCKFVLSMYATFEEKRARELVPKTITVFSENFQAIEATDASELTEAIEAMETTAATDAIDETEATEARYDTSEKSIIHNE